MGRREYRFDPLQRCWSIIATGRDDRPREHRLATPPSPTDVACEFCPGHEENTPAAIHTVFEVCLAPRGHRHDFAACNDRELRHLARHVGRTSRRLDDVLASPSFNLILHTGPVTQVDESAGPGSKIAVAYHWHIEILPRLTTMAGFEWATGVFINSVVPEDAAASLRSS